MNCRYILTSFLLVLPIAVAWSDSIIPGNRIFIQARVVGCGETIRNVEFGEVQDSGELVVFEDISLHVEGKTTEEVAEMVTDAVGKKSGHRPTSIRVIAVPEEDDRRATMMMLEIAHLKLEGCRRRIPPTETPDWLLDLLFIAAAPHN